jgi:hypothetical protein
MGSVAEATGDLLVTAGNHARALWEYSDAHGLDLYPRPRRGGAHKETEPQPRHLANYLLSRGAGQPAEGPAAAVVLGGLVRLHDDRNPADLVPEGSSWAPPSSPQLPSKAQAALTLHGLLERLIAGWGAASADERAAIEAKAREADWALTLSHERAVAAWIIWKRPDGLPVQWTYGSPEPTLGIPSLPGPFELPQRRARIERLTRIPFSLIIVAAEQWASSLARRGDLKLSGPGNTGNPELKKPALLQEEPASETNQRPQTEPPATCNPEGSGVRENRQANPADHITGGAGNSQHEEPPGHGHRPHSLDAAAA